MAFLNWTESLSVKINSIDEQHKKLIELINGFYEQVSHRTNDENISILLKGMKDYTQMHFDYEEKYMKQFNYPDYPSHKKEHDFFISKVAEVEEKVKKGKVVLSFEITSFLKDWIKNHIQGSDKKYTAFFIKNGIK
ncbi:MAG: hemerythrin [Bacteroidales bacterium]|nr:MAG: hemerythrin [Bacteroidales bacterium]